MSNASLFQRLRGPFNFLEPRLDALHSLLPEEERLLPTPRHIFLEDENATPVFGFPIRRSPGIVYLGSALHEYIASEERAVVATLQGSTFDIPRHQRHWETYRKQLSSIAENVTTSNYGRDFPQIFWLYHSLDLVSSLKGTAARVRQLDLEIGRARGDEIRFLVLSKYLERVFRFLYDLAARLAREGSGLEEKLFPPLLTKMRDNVLILTEDHIGRDLNELRSYFRGYLKIDGADLLYRLALLRRWHAEILLEDAQLRSAAEHLIGGVADTAPEYFLHRQGYLAFLSRHPAYDAKKLLDEHEVKLWESLLVKLKEFELFHSLRRLCVELESRGTDLVCDARAANRLGAGADPVALNQETRPLDFAAPWIVDPEVSRGGLIYDLVDFTSLVSQLRMSGRDYQDDSFRQIFLFQRQVSELASRLRLRMEKYLGDGAFFSGRNVRRIMIAALLMQRAYRKALDGGFPFNQGLRIALNYGSYRLLPLGTATGEIYEAFGHGLVELSRLVTGKRRLDLDDIKRTLVIKGYDDTVVHDFFAPMAALDATSPKPEEFFHAEVDANGSLVNQGMVVTEAFLRELVRTEEIGPFHSAMRDRHRYVTLSVAAEDGEAYPIGLRRLGHASLKGLHQVDVYEMVDGESLDSQTLQPTGRTDLLETLRESFSASVAGG